MESNLKTAWIIDPAHSEIHFKVRHLVITTVTGSFTKFEGSMESKAEDFNDAVITFKADVNSLNTNAPDRDTHLKSPDFFDAANHPFVTFISKSFYKTGDDKYRLTGDITIRGTTREISLDVEYGGTTNDPWGNTRAGFELSGKLNRKEFGLKWDAITETGNAVVSDEVKLLMSVEMVKQK